MSDSGSVEVLLSWDGHNGVEEVIAEVTDEQNSFQTKKQLTKPSDDPDGRFSGYVHLVPGNYLLRYYVDGDIKCNTSGTMISAAGEDYNSLVVLPEDSSDDEEDEEAAQVADDQKSSTEGSAAQLNSTSQHKKKKKRKNKKRVASEPEPDSAAGFDTKSLRHDPKRVIESLYRELYRREAEWKEAWLAMELRHSTTRQKEQASLSEKFREERNQWVAKIRGLEQAVASLREANISLKGRVDTEASGSQLASSALVRQTQQLTDDNKALAAQADKFRAEKVQLDDQLARAQSELEKLRREREREQADMKSRLAELGSKESTWRKEAGSESERLQQRVSELNADIARRDQDIRSIQEKLASSQEQLNEQRRESDKIIEEKEARLRELAALLEAATLTANTLKQAQIDQNNESERKSAEQAIVLQAQINSLTAEAKAKESTIADLKTKAAQLDAQLKQLEHAGVEKDRAHAAAREEIDRVSRSLNEVTSQNVTLTEQTVQLTAEVTRITEEHANARKQIRELEDAQAELKQQSERTGAQRQQLEADLAQAKQDVASQKTENSRLSEELDSSRSKLQLAQAQFEREKEQLIELGKANQENLDNVKQNLICLAGALRGASTEFAALRNEQLQGNETVNAEFKDFKKQMLSQIQLHNAVLEDMTSRYKLELAERRKYFNLVQELRGSIRVFCRTRPLLASDTNRGLKSIITTSEGRALRLQKGDKPYDFEFDKAFGGDSTQEAVFDEVKPTITSVLDGYNACIFAYGQTGSGKTFTMEGSTDNRGVNFRALSELFRVRSERKAEFSYSFSVSMMEIYNENIRDLLDSTEKECKIRKGAQGMFVDGLFEQPVDSEEDVIAAMASGARNRSTSATQMNEHSSRSHSLLCVRVRGENHITNSTYFGKLYLIDLAGSERVGRTGATGDRLKEAQAINKSLSALGNCISALQTKSAHVPYRDSKLTFLLEDSLGGHAKTLMFVNVSPCEGDAEETLCSLQFATRVRRVELGTAARNVMGRKVAKADEGDAVEDEEGDAVDDIGDDAVESKMASPAAKPIRRLTSTPAAAPRAGGVSVTPNRGPATQVSVKKAPLGTPTQTSVKKVVGASSATQVSVKKVVGASSATQVSVKKAPAGATARPAASSASLASVKKVAPK